MKQLSKSQLSQLNKGLAEKGGKFWTPKEMDKIYGKVISIKNTETKKGKKIIKSQLLTLDTTAKGELKIWLSTVLANEFKAQKVKVGDVVAIQYIEDTGTYLKYAVSKL